MFKEIFQPIVAALETHCYPRHNLGGYNTISLKHSVVG